MTAKQVVDFVKASREKRGMQLLREVLYLHPEQVDVMAAILKEYPRENIDVAAAVRVPLTDFDVPPDGAVLVLRGHYRDHVAVWNSETGEHRRRYARVVV